MSGQRYISNNGLQPAEDGATSDRPNVQWGQSDGVASVHVNKTTERIDPVRLGANVRVLKQAQKLEPVVDERYDALLQQTRETPDAWEMATKRMTPDRRETRKAVYRETHEKQMDALRVGTHSFVNRDGKVEKIFNDPQKQMRWEQFLYAKYGKGDTGTKEIYQTHFNAYHDVQREGKDGEEGIRRRMEQLAAGRPVTIRFPEGRTETIQIDWPEEVTHGERFAILRSMWAQRGLLMEMYDTEVLIGLQNHPNPLVVGEYEDILIQFQQSDEQQAAMRLDDLVGRVPEVQESVNNRAIVERQVIDFGRGVSIPTREIKQIEGGAIAQKGIEQIQIAFAKLSQEGQQLIRDLVRRAPDIVGALLLSPSLTQKSATIEADIAEWPVRLKHSKGGSVAVSYITKKGREETVSLLGPLTKRFDEAVVRGAQGDIAGETNYFDHMARHMHTRLIEALIPGFSPEDGAFITRQQNDLWRYMLEVVREGRRGEAADKSALQSLGILSRDGVVIDIDRVSKIGFVLRVRKAQNQKPSFDQLLALANKWDEEAKQAPLAFDRTSEAHDVGEISSV